MHYNLSLQRLGYNVDTSKIKLTKLKNPLIVVKHFSKRFQKVKQTIIIQLTAIRGQFSTAQVIRCVRYQ